MKTAIVSLFYLTFLLHRAHCAARFGATKGGQEEEVSGKTLAKADKIGKSENLVTNSSFVWVIDNFEYWIWPGFNLQSPIFTVKHDERRLDFSIRLKEGEKGHMMLSVQFEPTSSIEMVHLKTKVSLLGHDGKVLWSKDDFWDKRGVRPVHKDQAVTWEDFVVMEKLFQMMGQQKDLPVMVEMQIPNPTHNSTKPKGTKEYMRAKISECQSFSEIGAKLFNDTTYCDIEFEFPEKGETVPAHRAILHVRAPKLLAASGPIKRVEEGNETKNVIEIKDMDQVHFTELLEYVYTDKEPVDLAKKATDFFKAARKYGLKELMEAAQHEIHRTISIDNAVNLIKLSEQENLPQLKKDVFEYIRENANLVSPERWEKLLTELMETMQCDADTLKEALEKNDVELLKSRQRKYPTKTG